MFSQAGASDERLWLVREGGADGPFALDDLRARVAEGRLARDAPVRLGDGGVAPLWRAHATVVGRGVDPGDDGYYVVTADGDVGPFAPAALRATYAAGLLADATEVRKARGAVPIAARVALTAASGVPYKPWRETAVARADDASKQGSVWVGALFGLFFGVLAIIGGLAVGARRRTWLGLLLGVPIGVATSWLAIGALLGRH